MLSHTAPCLARRPSAPLEISIAAISFLRLIYCGISDENEKPFFQKRYDDAVEREREEEAAARATSIADQVALLQVREANADRFQERLVAVVAALVRLRTLEDLESRVTALEQQNHELQAEILSLKQSQLSAPRPPNPQPAVVPVSQSSTILTTRTSGTVTSTETGASSSSGSAGSSALVIVPNAGTSAQNATVLTGVQYSGPVVDKWAATLPSKYDGKGDITPWISSMRSYFEVLRTPHEDRGMIMGTNTEPVVRNFIELQAVTAGYERIDLTEWLKVTPVRTLEDLLITRHQDKHAALKARLKLEALKGQTWRTSMQALEQHLTGLFTTPDLGMTGVSCMDVVMEVAPEEYHSLLGLKDHTTWRELMTDLVNLEAKDLARRKKAPAAGGKSQRKRYGSSNQLALHEHREVEDQSYMDDLSLDDDLEPDSDMGCSTSAIESDVNEDEKLNAFKKTASSKGPNRGSVVIAVNSRSGFLSLDEDDPPPEVPTNIHRLLDRFPEVLDEPRGVPNRPVKHKIEIIEGSVPPKGCVYRMGQGELEELRRQIDDMIDSGWIRPSESEFVAPVLFVSKKGGKLPMCIDYRGLSRITQNNAYPLPRIDDLLNAAGGCKVFSKIDLKSGYHQIEVDPSDQHKTAFKTRDGLYEFIVMPFGLTNAPATFQCLIDNVLRHQLNRFVVVYLDDILIFTKSMEEHVKHLEEVLQVLKEIQLHLNLEKSEFGRDSVIYLGHRLSANGLEPDATKVEVIRKWPQPANVRELRSFLGLASYYRKFVPKFSVIAHPLSRLTGKNVAYAWCEKCETAFQALIEALVSHHVLCIANPNLTFVVTTDASQFGIGAVLQQDDGDGLRLLEYYSKRMPSHKVATSTYMRELYALREALAYWKHYLLGRQFKVYSDHQTLLWIQTQIDLAPTLTRWLHDIDVYSYQNTWDKELHKVKGLYNNFIHSATGVTPNQLQYGWQLRNPLSYLFPERSPGLTPGMLGYNAKYARLLKAAIAAMNKRQHAVVKHANKSRKERTFEVGSYVWVKMSEFSDEEGISRKLLPLYYGPWQVLKVIGDDFGPSYVLGVSAHLRTYPVFHASKLFPHIDDETFPFRDPMIPRPIDGGHEIDRIVSHEGRGRNRQYKVHFLYHPLTEFLWIGRKELL
ncbi:hypothetical protein CBR_g25995 [Chara braunii]|uniref:Reverse transcriptase domain-containing protein n=1 Tax=Chara braunii TaxID=69332 RepID=A0A388L704_CHABU|nr:hypothetical protein CBR_g25995 [Chara braunii]|eukprot:GBG78058.1 hypothetical protein CBR_g25995 [Chara braunii]